MLKALPVLGLILLCLAPATAEIIVKGASKPFSAIYLAPGAPDSVRLAATELQTVLKTEGLGELPIREQAEAGNEPAIYLGDTAISRRLGLKHEKPDSFAIRTDNGNLVIAGRDYSGPPMTSFLNPYRLNESYNTKLKIGAFGDAGTLFGVYHFLEKFTGIRWYMPGPLGTVWPEPRTRLEVPDISIEKAPHFEQRHAYYGFFDRSDDDTLWYRRAGYGSPFPVPISHSFAHFFMKYKDTHPEYFALINGERDFTNLSTVGPGNFDLSNEGFVQQVIKDANQFFKDNPEQKIFPLCPNDGMKKISEDPLSQAQLDPSREKEGGKFSNYVWGFVNKVAEGIAKEHPDRYVGCFAYEQYCVPPSNIEKLHPNVVVVICKLRRAHFDPAALAETRKRVAGWRAKVDRIYAWEYYCDILLNGGWKGYPVFFPRLVQDDMDALQAVSKGEFIEAESWMPGQYSTDPQSIKINYPALQHPLLYVTARLLWEPELDLKVLLDEYFRLFYGPAEPEMREFWTRAEQAWMAQKAEIPADFLTPAQMAAMVKLLEQAREKTPIDGVYRRRIDLIYAEFTPATERAQRLAAMEKPVAEIPRFTTPPPASADWTQAPVWATSRVIKLLDTNFLIAKPPTHLRLGWDQAKLYVAFTCFEPSIGDLIARVDQPDEGSIWSDDSVEIFIMQPGRDDQGAHFIVNSKGKLWDARRDATQLAQTQWRSHAVAVSHLGTTQWNVLVEIPWSDLGVEGPVPGLKFKANFYRNREIGKPTIQSSWAPLMENTYYSPKDYGTLILEK